MKHPPSPKEESHGLCEIVVESRNEMQLWFWQMTPRRANLLASMHWSRNRIEVVLFSTKLEQDVEVQIHQWIKATPDDSNSMTTTSVLLTFTPTEYFACVQPLLKAKAGSLFALFVPRSFKISKGITVLTISLFLSPHFQPIWPLPTNQQVSLRYFHNRNLDILFAFLSKSTETMLFALNLDSSNDQVIFTDNILRQSLMPRLRNPRRSIKLDASPIRCYDFSPFQPSFVSRKKNPILTFKKDRWKISPSLPRIPHWQAS